ncbi:TPA: hypothetical protein QB394_001190, partial [Pasteurella multocida]|nr:hypothetical protein [Pasteurella multocida]HDR1475661.1 hypothetical protein [Pasteurella multocida]
LIPVGIMFIYIYITVKERLDKQKKYTVSTTNGESSYNQIMELKKQIRELSKYIDKKEKDCHLLEQKIKTLSNELFNTKIENTELESKSSHLYTNQNERDYLKKTIVDLKKNNTVLQNKLQKIQSVTKSTKECPACKRIQPITEFNQNSNQPDGLTKWCTKCLDEGAPMPHNVSGTKICEKCGQNRRKSSFYPSSKYTDGLSKWCKFCLDNKK